MDYEQFNAAERQIQMQKQKIQQSNGNNRPPLGASRKM
eukprot:CAMPEP_0202963088 /NCGR_PEP_ID=MMETSP1396-20130829/7081_1 /ASSEMBLY_ACC=CAM_ASM_000872 /TAXON_ID= /ORGANISM="Pseudokeronopsis sp., Strain Brazil" /LENGTH=37 /DNA_ID= /DNA_START= /DNA_END= /DNA_ORIENTATION=